MGKRSRKTFIMTSKFDKADGIDDVNNCAHPPTLTLCMLLLRHGVCNSKQSCTVLRSLQKCLQLDKNRWLRSISLCIWKGVYVGGCFILSRVTLGRKQWRWCRCCCCFSAEGGKLCEAFTNNVRTTIFPRRWAVSDSSWSRKSYLPCMIYSGEGGREFSCYYVWKAMGKGRFATMLADRLECLHIIVLFCSEGILFIHTRIPYSLVHFHTDNTKIPVRPKY